MPQTPSAITNFSPGRTDRAAAKALSQPSNDATKTFASLLGIEKPTKANSISKKLRSGEASSSAKADEDLASQIASHEAVNNTYDRNVASTASNPAQFAPGGLTLTFASCIPIPGAGKDVSVSQNPGADKAARCAYVRAGDPMTAFATGTSPALDTAANDAAARKPKTLTAPYAAISLNVVAKRPETPPAPHSTEAAMTASQSAQASDQRREPSFRFPASDAGNNSDYKIAAAVPSADPAQAPGPAVVLSSKTHFVPEAPRSEAMVSVAAQMATGASRQDQAKASRDFTQPRTKATSQAAQRLDTITDGSAAAEGHAGNPTYTVSAPEQSATPSKRGGSSPDASAKDTASHRSASSGPDPGRSAPVLRAKLRDCAWLGWRFSRDPGHNRSLLGFSAPSRRPITARRPPAPCNPRWTANNNP